MAYHPRIADAELDDRLARAGAVVIEGAKACGKTATALQKAKSAVRLDEDLNARDLAAIAPALVLEGETPRLLDEWQLAPDLWNAARVAVNDRQSVGQFILTGSARPSSDITRHSGAGRMSTMRMRPMSLFESGGSSGRVSLAALLRGQGAAVADPKVELTDLLDAICRGGWPGLQDLALRDAQGAVIDYLQSIMRVDVSAVGNGRRRDPRKVEALMRALARNVATYVSLEKLLATAKEEDDVELARSTTGEYLDALRDLMIIEDQPAWGAHLRATTRVKTASKRHFVDPSLAVAALGANPAQLVRDLNYTGFLFESLAVRDLRIYSQPFRGEVTQAAQHGARGEVDAIVKSGENDEWALIEIKLGARAEIMDRAAGELIAFRSLLPTDLDAGGTPRVRPPVLVIVVGSGAAYTRPDGVHVVPIGLLGP